MTDRNLIVDEMITRLRALQGSGEFPPLTRMITAGDGLEGGGDLSTDITVSLDAAILTLVAELADMDLGSLVNDSDLSTAVEDLLTATDIAPRVFYRDFTVSDSPIATITAPPIRADNPCTITRITMVVAAPGMQQVQATVAGQVITAAAGAESTTTVVAVNRTAGQTIPVSVAPTDAAGIVVSVRCEEAGVL